MMTVKMGAELFTVSAKDTATFFRLTKPRTTVMNLTNGGKDFNNTALLVIQSINTELASACVNPSNLCYFLLSHQFHSGDLPTNTRGVFASKTFSSRAEQGNTSVLY